MRASQLVASAVLALVAVWLVAALVVLALDGPGLATVVTLAVVGGALAGACAVGVRSRRSPANPYW